MKPKLNACTQAKERIEEEIAGFEKRTGDKAVMRSKNDHLAWQQKKMEEEEKDEARVQDVTVETKEASHVASRPAQRQDQDQDQDQDASSVDSDDGLPVARNASSNVSPCIPEYTINRENGMVKVSISNLESRILNLES